MKWVLDPTVAISKTELAQLLEDVADELAMRRSSGEETDLEDRCGRMLARLGSAGVFSE